MKIACLQFAPVIGEVDNNLNRADSVLTKADQKDLDNLDVLVLPELAFSGCNFHSARQAAPLLERSGCGISALWSRTVALKYDCNVVVGYPERSEASTTDFTTVAGHYNSALLISGEGDTIVNYRKKFLHPAERIWASDSRQAFYTGNVRGLGRIAMGIGADLDPHQVDTPWNPYELADHIMKTKAKLVILPLSWVTKEDPGLFNREMEEPDMESLNTWIRRLDPLIRLELTEEIIIVFSNRCGNDDDVQYAGTSAVIGIKEGEVTVYGILGRGAKQVLVVDTTQPPYAKLVHRGAPAGDTKISALQPEPAQTPDVGPRARFDSTGTASAAPMGFGVKSSVSPQDSIGNSSPGGSSPAADSPRRMRPTSPKLHIPYVPTLDEIALSLARTGSPPVKQHLDPDVTSPDVDTPCGPSPVPDSIRPKLSIPTPWANGNSAPYPNIVAQIGSAIAERGDNTESTSPTTPMLDLDGDTPASPQGGLWSRQASEVPTSPTVPWLTAVRGEPTTPVLSKGLDLRILALKSSMRIPGVHPVPTFPFPAKSHAPVLTTKPQRPMVKVGGAIFEMSSLATSTKASMTPQTAFPRDNSNSSLPLNPLTAVHTKPLASFPETSAKSTQALKLNTNLEPRKTSVASNAESPTIPSPTAPTISQRLQKSAPERPRALTPDRERGPRSRSGTRKRTIDEESIRKDYKKLSATASIPIAVSPSVLKSTSAFGPSFTKGPPAVLPIKMLSDDGSRKSRTRSRSVEMAGTDDERARSRSLATSRAARPDNDDRMRSVSASRIATRLSRSPELDHATISGNMTLFPPPPQTLEDRSGRNAVRVFRDFIAARGHSAGHSRSTSRHSRKRDSSVPRTLHEQLTKGLDMLTNREFGIDRRAAFDVLLQRPPVMREPWDTVSVTSGDSFLYG